VSARSAYARMTTLLFLPSKLVEETLHALAAWPWADRLAVVVEPATGDAHVQADVDGAPRWALALIRFAPTIAGVVLGAAAIAAVASGVRPASFGDLVGALFASIWWAALVHPDPPHPPDPPQGDR
jgi:hypothetical protein